MKNEENKKIKVMKKYIYMLIAVVAPLFTACSDDDNSQSATMTISQI